MSAIIYERGMSAVAEIALIPHSERGMSVFIARYKYDYERVLSVIVALRFKFNTVVL